MQMYISHEVTFTSLMEAVCGRKKVLRGEKIPSPHHKTHSLKRSLFFQQNTEMQFFGDIISNLKMNKKVK